MSLLRVVLRYSLLPGLFLSLFQVPAAYGQVSPRVVEAVDDAQRITLKGNVHPLARPEFDRGVVPDAQAMNRILLLLRRSDAQEAALQDLLQKQQDKSTPSFHQWLTPAEFGARFGPADSDIQAVSDWLTRQGFSIGKIYSGKTVIEFSGTAAQVQRAFGTAIHNYQVNGKLYSANASDPQIPAALAPVVAGVVSLHNFPRQFYELRFGTLRRTAGKSVFEPLVTVPNSGGSGNFYGVGPGDFAKIYGIPATCGNPAVACTGAGQTIAVVEETNIAVSDVQQFRSVFGLPANFTAANIILNGEDPGITSTDEESEADLDTEWAGAVAPGATIQFVLSASTAASQGVDLSALYIVGNNLAGAMSESYGACESSLGTTENAFINNLWEQASAQGITVAVSTGDSGSAGCDDPSAESLATQAVAVNGLASTPYNIAVGGTDFDEYNYWSEYWSSTNNSVTGTSALGYITEIPWNQSCAQLGASGCNINTTPVQLQNIVAGGGGSSQQYSKPSWQVGTAGMPNDGKRDLPDVSLFASPGFNGSGYLYCQEDVGEQCINSSGFSGSLQFGVIGGTSAGAPAFAGIMALVNQSQATTQNSAPRQGNANYVLYELAHGANAICASQPPPVAATCIFNDITHGSDALPTGGKGIGTNSVPCKGGIPGCSAAAGQIGVLGTVGSPDTLAWLAGSGYDLTTGLGSLNVGNLLSSWATASTVPTTTTLTLHPTTGITHGSENAENVTATISVVPQSGTATGTVSLIATPTTGVQMGAGAFTLGANGSVTARVVNLPGGTSYPVYAHYSGDGKNAPSDSAPQTVTVAQESSKTFIAVPTFDSSGNQTNANATSVTYGSQYIIRVYVTNSAGSASTTGAPNGACTQTSPVTCPSGTIALTANGNAVDGGTFTLNNIGYTRDLSADLPGGTYPLTAAYSGDTSYQASSTSETFTVNPAPTTLAAPFEGSNVSLVGQSTWFIATLSTQVFYGVAPTGTITFYDGSTPLGGTVTLTPTGPTGSTPAALSAEIYTTFTTPGTHTITAKYSGDANYMAATSSSSATLDVVYQTAISLNGSASAINFGQSITLTAVVTSQAKSPAITGQVNFSGPSATYSNITTVPGTDSNGNQMLSVTATVVPQGPGYFLATYPGDTNYGFAASTPFNVSVNIPDFTLGPQTGLSVVATAGQTGSGQITIAPVSSTQMPSPVNLQVSQTSFPGYTIGISPAQVNLNGAPVTATLTLAPVTTGSTNAIRAQIRKAGILGVESGEWWRLGLAMVSAGILLLGSRRRRRRLRAVLSLSLISLLYFGLGCGGGGGGGGGSGSGTGGGITAQPSSITLSTSNPKAPQNSSFTITATVTGTGVLNGNVTFYDYGNAIAAPIPVSNGLAQLGDVSYFLVGVHQITAQYSGDASHLPSTSSVLTQTITGTFSIMVQGATGADFHNLPATVGLQ